MKITREAYTKALSAAKDESADIDEIVEQVLEIFHVTVEPKPILPVVTGGKWGIERDGDVWDIWATFKTGPKRRIAYQLSSSTDAQVMAGSKTLVELMMKWLLEDRGHFKNMSPELQAIVNQVAKMGADVREVMGD